MKQMDVPAALDLDPALSISKYLVRHGTRTPRKPMFVRKMGETWVDLSAGDVLAQVRGIAKGLLAHGYGKGDHIAIMGRTSIEWAVTDLAIWHIGAVPVPIYETSSPAQAQWIVSDAGCVAAFAESSGHAAVIEAARAEDGGHGVREVFRWDGGDLETLTADGAHLDDAAADAGHRDVGLEDVATIIYTSGTTGRPKGAVLTHGNFIRLAEEAVNKLEIVVRVPGARTLLFIPLAHVFARFIGVLMMMESVPIGFSPDAKQAVSDIATFKPTVLLSVPRVWEKVYTAAELKQGKGVKRSLFRWAVRVAVTYSRALDSATGPDKKLLAQYRLADRLVYSKIRALMGGQLTWTISGGAPLGERLGHFYRGVGINMLEGYGLTETTAPTNVNIPVKVKIGTVGPPLPGTSLRIADDGEILARGVGIFQGYHNNPEGTAEALQDGWFHTGDIGSLDEDGYLTITGRKKEIIVTAAGKNVAPAQLEDPLRSHPIISQAVVVGDKRPFVAVLITLDAETLPKWLETHNRQPMSVHDAARDPLVRQHIQMAVDRANRKVSHAEAIKEFRILDDDFTMENDLLTPSMKVKRHLVLQRYADVIDEIYSHPKPAGTN